MLEQKNIIVSIAGGLLSSYQKVLLKQTINDHHYFELVLDIETGELYDTHTLERSKDWVGEKVEINFGNKQFIGIVTQVSLKRSSGNYGCLIASGYSMTFLLESDLHCASWLNKTLADIVKEICDKVGLSVLVNPEYKDPIEYESQYMESDFDFLRRLARQYHEWFYYDGRQLVFGKPQLPSAIPLTYNRDIFSMDMNIQAIARPLKVQSYNSKVAQMYDSTSPNVPQGLNSLGQSVFGSSMKMFKSPSVQYSEMRITNASELKYYLQRKQQSDSAASHYINCETDNTCIDLGSVVSIQTSIHVYKSECVEKLLGSYFVTEITHSIESGNNYRNQFSAVSSSVNCLPVPNVPLPVAQTQQAVVIDNEDPKGQGRVQVKMNWQSGNMKTSWIRVMTPDAGSSDAVSKNRGLVFIPEKDDIVLVGFRYGDPNRPFVFGSLFNGITGTGGGSGNKKKSLTTRSGCTITIDDDKGSVTMKDKSGNSYSADGDGNIVVSASKSIKLCVGETMIILDCDGNITSNAQNNISENAANNISQQADSIDSTAVNEYNINGTDVTATAEGSAMISGGTSTTVDSSGTTAVTGSIIKLN